MSALLAAPSNIGAAMAEISESALKLLRTFAEGDDEMGTEDEAELLAADLIEPRTGRGRPALTAKGRALLRNSSR